ncbi:vesicular glutamate transporter 1-like [Schistocerca americana]|uniref:vesicular glutamate transporter 1-like n=1 Tax=Schistocerca americana TaxID=7009 RepID=UPI001F4F6EE8|nr:vesicular glutamate transporter 1-like [Schistocerca americana]
MLGRLFRISSEEMPEVPLWKVWRRRRYVVTLLTFLGFFNLYALRVNVSVVIVDMTENKTHTDSNGTVVRESEFDWDTELQGLVLSSFFYGYICTQLLGGWLALRVGGAVLMTCAVAVSAVLALVTPVLVRLSVYAFIAIRVIQGLVQLAASSPQPHGSLTQRQGSGLTLHVFQGMSYPAAQAMWSQWAPPRERSVLANVGYAGCDLGSVVAMTVSGVITAKLGWPAVFYIFGFVALAWTALWVLVVRRAPKEDHHIDPREQQYIEESLGGPPEHQNQEYPWKNLLTSMPVWAVLVANFTANWGFYTMLTELPTFMKETLNFNIEESGILSALPSLLMLFILPLAGFSADWLINRKLLTIGQVRKTFCCGSFIVQAVFMMVVAYVMKPVAAVASLTTGVGIGAFAYSSFFVNPLDIAPQYASIIVGLSNTAGTVPGIVSPILIGHIVPNRTEKEWRLVFLITSAVYIVGTILYGIFASGETQRWAKQGQK